MKYAPVLIPTLNRWKHFRRCIESLTRCTHADNTLLYVALDYPSKEEHWEGYYKTSEYIKTIQGFQDVIVIRREYNYGAVRNNDEAQDMIYETSDRIICIDDDNQLAPGFLDYINKGLELFKDDTRVSAICGFPRMVQLPENYLDNFYVDYSFNAWGYGTWKRVWNAQHWDEKSIHRILKRPFELLKIYNQYESLALLLVNMINNKKVYGDAYWVVNNITYNCVSIYPAIGKVRNWGFDGTGVHCGILQDSPYHLVDIDSSKIFEFSSNRISLDTRIHRQISKKAKLSFKGQIKLVIEYMKYWWHQIVPKSARLPTNGH